MAVSPVGEAMWIAAGKNASSVSIALPGVPNVASQYEVQAISDITVTKIVDVAPVIVFNKVLFITKAATLTPKELEVKSRLADTAGLKYTVTTVGMTEDYLTSIPDYDLIVVSQEIEMLAVGIALKSVKKPVFALGYVVPNAMSIGYCASGNGDNDSNKGTVSG